MHVLLIVLVSNSEMMVDETRHSTIEDGRLLPLLIW